MIPSSGIANRGGASVVGNVPSSSSVLERAHVSSVAASQFGLSGTTFPRIHPAHHQLMTATNQGAALQLLQAAEIPSQNLLRLDRLFPYILHGLLGDVEKANGGHIISWSTDGKAFRIHNPDAFLTQIVPTYFLQRLSFRDFLYKLDRWGFTQHENGFCFHPYFVRSSPALCVYIAWIESPRQVHAVSTRLICSILRCLGAIIAYTLSSSKETHHTFTFIITGVSSHGSSGPKQCRS
jgi:hypothetical protein